MNWKEFFKITSQKLKIIALIVIFFYIMLYLEKFIVAFAIPLYYKSTNDLIMSFSKQPYYFQESGAISLLCLIIVSYFFACIISSMLGKRGKK